MEGILHESSFTTKRARANVGARVPNDASERESERESESDEAKGRRLEARVGKARALGKIGRAETRPTGGVIYGSHSSTSRTPALITHTSKQRSGLR